MPFSWFRKRDEPKGAPASSSMENPSSHQPQTSSHPTDSNTMSVAGSDLNELYKQEWPNGPNEGSFRGKQEEIKAQFYTFWSIPGAQEDVNAYLVNAEHKYSKTVPGWIRGKTPFTNYEKKPLAEDDDVIIIGNYASFDIAQYPKNSAPAGMSMIHLLGLTTKSIYNGVSLDESNIHVIDRIIKLFISKWSDDEFRKKVLDHQLGTIERLKEDAVKAAAKTATEAEKDAAEAAANEGYELAKLHYDELERKIDGLEVDDFEFGLHLYPDNSVPHFHMHIIAMRKGMRKYSTSKHDKKTKDACEVRDYVREFVPAQKEKIVMEAEEAEKAKKAEEAEKAKEAKDM